MRGGSACYESGVKSRQPRGQETHHRMPASSSCMHTADLMVHGSPAGKALIIAWHINNCSAAKQGRMKCRMACITDVNARRRCSTGVVCMHREAHCSPLLSFSTASVYLMCPCELQQTLIGQ